MNKKCARFGAAIAAVLLSGCGGGGSSTAGPGAFGVTIQWPTQRTIPELTQQMNIRVVGPGVNEEQTIGRPTNGATSTDVQFTGLPLGQLLVLQCNAYGAAVSGNAPLLGIAETSVTLNTASGNSVTLDVQSTIQSLEITGKDLTGGTLTLPANASSNLTVTAFSTSSTMVPIGPGNLSFTSVGLSGIGFAPSGNTITLTAGSGPTSGTLTVTEAESGKTVTINVVVP